MAAAQAIKALKLPTPERDERPYRGHRPAPKGDRRADGHRHGRPSGPRPAAHANGERRDQGQQRLNGQSRDGAARTDGQRHPHRAEGHPAHRPSGGGRKRPFNRRGGPSRFNRAQG
jgi:hypothetical protein